MNRRKFIRQTCLGCLGGGIVPLVLTNCQSTHYATGTIEANGIVVPVSEFTYLKKEQTVLRPYILVQNDTLEFPIYVYRFSENEYSALWMKCTHQGSELQASGDHLHCPSHGSEFNNKGTVSQGPAEKNLKTFPVTVSDGKIKIDLRPS
jgi:Rieske Fe-S protein